MRRLVRIAISIMLQLACLPLLAAPHATCGAIGAQVLESIKDEDYTAAASRFGDAMKAALPADKLRAVMQQLAGKYGGIERLGSAETAEASGGAVATIPIHFANGTLDARFACDDGGKVTGLHFVPHRGGESGENAYRMPDYAAHGSFDERRVVVGAHRLPGIVVIPRSGAPVPGVVLVHGSGPLDMDESVGPNKPFLDLALGLAADGIASLRYEKRTRAHPELFAGKSYTLDDEVIEDAASALTLMRSTPGVDPQRVFVLGHSLGARLAPFVARRTPVRGLVLLAAPAAPLADVLQRQAEYLARSHGHATDEERHALAQFEEEVGHLRELLAGRTPGGPLPFGLPAQYLEQLALDDPIEASAALHVPVLVLQGERDYQVTVADDFSLWRARFAHDPLFTLKSYAELNHLFERGSGPEGPAEYEQAGNVSAQVVRDIAAWIRTSSA